MRREALTQTVSPALALCLAAALSACGPQFDDDLLLIGHRGSPTEAPENSLEGFRLAYEQGADGIEFDVQLTADGTNVVMHDETVDRTTSCSGRVQDFTVQELRGCTLSNGETVVPLAEMLTSIDGLFELLFLELKVPEDSPLTTELIQTQVTDAVTTVTAKGFADRTVIISYDHTALLAIADSQTRGVVGGWDDFTTESITNAKRYDLPWVLMPIRTIEPWMGDIIVGLDRKLAVYQVVTYEEFVTAVEGQSHAIIVDSPRTMAALLGRKPRKLP
ncbi:MAG: glycerophosphodiester phosphodiesterase [Polyangiaceae bacterium]